MSFCSCFTSLLSFSGVIFIGKWRSVSPERYSVLGFMCVLFLFSSPLALEAQNAAPTITETAREAHIYRLLFRQALAYERLASEADAEGSSKPYLRRILRDRLQLNDADSVTLLRLSQAYQVDVAPIRRDIVREKATLMADFPLGLKPSWKPLKSTAALDALHAQEDGVSLRYRDLLRNDMGSDAFQRMVTQLYASFGQRQLATP